MYKLHKINNDFYIINEKEKINTKIDLEKLENFEYYIKNKNDLIDDLIWFIAESKNFYDKIEMKKDLKALMDLEDDYIFSSNNTNEYVARSQDQILFDAICEDILAL